MSYSKVNGIINPVGIFCKIVDICRKSDDMKRYLIVLFFDQDIKVNGIFDNRDEAVKELTKRIASFYGYESWQEFGEGFPERYEYVRNNIIHNSGIMIDLGDDDDFGWMCYKLLEVDF